MEGFSHDLITLENKMYNRDASFKKFMALSENDIKRIDNDIKYRFPDNNSDGLLNYGIVLEYLTNSLIHKIYPDFDQRVLFLIRSTDKNLVILQEYFQTDLPSLELINNSSNIEATYLRIKRETNLELMKRRIREKIGFYNTKLLNYELAYFKRFLKNKEFAKKVNRSYFDRLMKDIPEDITFNLVSDDDYIRIKERVLWYLNETKGKIDAFTTSFHILGQNALLHLRSILEQYIFLIMTCDNDLNILRIYEEESKISEIKRRSIEELGFYSPELITIEKAYHKRFVPDKKVSIWSK